MTRKLVGIPLFAKGEKAMKKRDYGKAAEYFQRALDEFNPYPEAAFELALALQKQGKGPEALQAYLLCKDQCMGLEKPTRKQKKMCDKAEKAIGKLGRGYADRWHQIRVDVEGGKLTAYFNGDKFISYEHEDPETFAGMPSIFTQRGKFQIKDLGVKR